MGRPKARYPRYCIECQDRRVVATHRGAYCIKHFQAWRRTFPKCRYAGCDTRLGMPKGKPAFDKLGRLKKTKPKDSRGGYCRRHDHLLLKEPHRTPEQMARTLRNFIRAIEPDMVLGCWNWKGRTNGKYALLHVGKPEWLAHRYSFNLFIGGHRHGQTLDHVCRNALCVRPDHLLPVTPKRNSAMEHRKHTPESIARDLAQIPHMPPEVALWAIDNRLPIGRAVPGEPFGFGLDGIPVEQSGPTEYPGAKDLVRI